MTASPGNESMAEGTHVKAPVQKEPEPAVEQSANVLDKSRAQEPAGGGGTLIDQLRPGKLFVCFELERELYVGSTGAVWLAQDYSVWRQVDQVALKFLPDLVVSNKIAVEELKNKIRQRIPLKHPNILRVHDLMENRGILAIQMEHVDGQSLSQLRLSKPNQIFEVRDLEKWVKELCQALEYAHKEVGIFDSEIVPQNLIVDSAGNLQLKEFGIASCIAASMSRLMAVDDSTSETLPYMSPQRAAGENPAIADELYSLGATLYELLTSKPPYYTGDIRIQVSGKIPPSMTERRAELGIKGEPIPKNWEETVAACLAKDPAQRPQSAVEVEKRLKISPDFFVKPQPPLRSPLIQKPWLVIAGITFILVLVLVIAFFPSQHLTESKPRKSSLDTIPASGSMAKENFLTMATPSRKMSPKTALEVNPTPYTEVNPTPASELNPTPSPKATPSPSLALRSTPSVQGVTTPDGRQSASPSATPLSQHYIDVTKEEVLKRINALPGVTAEKKTILIEKMNKARSMERLAVIPFDIGQTTLHRAAADELVKAFSRPEMRAKLSDPTAILVVAGYADNGGRADKNLRISQERAENISKFLKEQAQLLNAMQTIGMGATELLDSERPDQNRAVEVWMVVPL
jgi:serine/threonine protein kinase